MEMTEAEKEDVRQMKNGSKLFFFFGSDRAQGDDVSCQFEDFAMVRQKCLSKGLMSCEMSITGQSSPGPLRTSHHILRTFSDRVISVCGVDPRRV
jgi:hypothetical protein